MNFEAITIRCAENTEVKEIWDLLHADGKGWSMEMIAENLDHILILCKQNKILGVLYGELNPYQTTVFWIVIHPLYPEEQLKQILVQGLKSALYPVEDKSRRSQKRTQISIDNECEFN